MAAGTRGEIAGGTNTRYGLGWQITSAGAYSHAGSDGRQFMLRLMGIISEAL